MVGDVLRGFERALVLQVGGNAGRPERMVSDPGFDAGAARPPLDHAVGVLLPQGLAGEHARLAHRRLEQRRVRISRDAGGGDVFVEVLLQTVVTGNLMLLAAFLVQAHPAAAALYEVVADLHLQHSAHAGEGIDHRADQRPVAQTDQRRLFGFGSVLAFRLSDGLDAVEQLSGLLGRQHRRFALLDDVFGAAHGVGRIHVEDVAGHQPVEEHAECGQGLLDRGRRKFALEVPHEGSDMEGLHVGELADAVCVAPLREAPGGVQVRLARVAVVDLGGKKLEDALRGLGRWREQRRGVKLSAWGDEDFGGRGEQSIFGDHRV